MNRTKYIALFLLFEHEMNYVEQNYAADNTNQLQYSICAKKGFKTLVYQISEHFDEDGVLM